MSSSEISPRPLLCNADDFNRLISEEVDAYDTQGNSQKMSYDSFVCHAHGLLGALKARVKELNKLPASDLNDETIRKGRYLLEQYEQFQALVVAVEIVARDMMGMLEFFDACNGNKFDGATTIKCQEDVRVVATGYIKRMTHIRDEFFTKAALRKGYLADSIEELKGHLNPKK